MTLTNNKTIWKFIGVIILMLISIFYLFYFFSSIFIVFIFGFILIFIAQKSTNFYNSLFKKIKVNLIFKKWLGYLLVFLFIAFLISIVYTSIVDITFKFNDPQFGDNSFVGIYEQNIKPYISPSLGSLFSSNNIAMIQESLIKFITKGVSSLGSFLFTSFLIIPLLFFVYFNRRKEIITNISNLIPHSLHKSLSRASQNISVQMGDYFSAKVTESTVIAFIASLGFYFIGLEGWLFLGILVGFLNIVPYVGPVLGSILPILVAITHSIEHVYLVIAIILFAQIIDNFYLIPFMVADKVKMDSLISIILILVGAKLFGAFGMIFIIPFYLISKIIIAQAYCELIKIYEK